MNPAHYAVAAIALSIVGLVAVVVSEAGRRAQQRRSVEARRAVYLADLAIRGMADVVGTYEIVATLPDGSTISRQIRFETLTVAEALRDKPDQVLARLAGLAVDRLAEGAYGHSVVQP